MPISMICRSLGTISTFINPIGIVSLTKLVNLIEKRDNINDDMKEQINDIVLDDDKAQQIVDAAKISMG